MQSEINALTAARISGAVGTVTRVEHPGRGHAPQAMSIW
jgi:hypothetical protein